jgi:hypothetical protein
MCCPLGTISKRSRLEIRLEDRLEYELERALYHSGAPGIDGVTFEAIEAQGVEALLEQLRDDPFLAERAFRLTEQIALAVSAPMGKRSPHEATCPRIASGVSSRTQHVYHLLGFLPRPALSDRHP